VADNSDTGLLREIDEELRKEHYASLWARFGKLIIAAVVLLVTSVAGYKGWQTYDISQRTEFGQQFSRASAAAANGDLVAAQDQFSALADQGTAGYQILAKLRTAALLAQSGDFSSAAASYRAIATGADTPTDYRDLALTLASINGLNAGETPSVIVDGLSSVIVDDNPWRHTAREIVALATLEMGNRDEALDILTALSSDNEAPAGVRNRAQELILALNAL